MHQRHGLHAQPAFLHIEKLSYNLGSLKAVFVQASDEPGGAGSRASGEDRDPETAEA